jgi:hypothetical protein
MGLALDATIKTRGAGSPRIAQAAARDLSYAPQNRLGKIAPSFSYLRFLLFKIVFSPSVKNGMGP